MALSDSYGNSCQSYEYSAYGQVAASDPNFTANPYMYTGRRFDYETGLYYYRARYYNPYIGRFLQTDPVGYDAGMNMYAYCINNPLSYADPSGLGRVTVRIRADMVTDNPTNDDAYKDIDNYLNGESKFSNYYSAWNLIDVYLEDDYYVTTLDNFIYDVCDVDTNIEESTIQRYFNKREYLYLQEQHGIMRNSLTPIFYKKLYWLSEFYSAVGMESGLRVLSELSHYPGDVITIPTLPYIYNPPITIPVPLVSTIAEAAYRLGYEQSTYSNDCMLRIKELESQESQIRASMKELEIEINNLDFRGPTLLPWSLRR